MSRLQNAAPSIYEAATIASTCGGISKLNPPTNTMHLQDHFLEHARCRATRTPLDNDHLVPNYEPHSSGLNSDEVERDVKCPSLSQFR